MTLLRHRHDDGGRMLSCRKVGKVLQQFLDGELDGITSGRVEQHLEACRRCGMEAGVYDEIKASLARAGSRVPEETLGRLRRFGAQLATDGDGPIEPSS